MSAQDPQTTEDGRRDFGVGGVLGGSVRILFDNLLSFLAIALLFNAPVYLFLIWLFWEGELAHAVPLWALEGGVLVVEVLLGFVTHAAVVYGTFRQLQGAKVGFLENVTRGIAGALPVVMVAVASTVMIMAGMLLLIVPGLMLATRYWVALPVAVVERRDIGDCLARSTELVSGYGWKVFGIIVIFGVVQSLAERVTEGFFDFGTQFYAALGLLWLLSAATTAFGAVVSAVSYYHLRRVKEGVDVDEIAAVFD